MSKIVSLNIFRDLDWNFAYAKTDYLTHSLHPYPCKFIPQVPHQLIQDLSVPGNTVADIFCGSGTTLVEAIRADRNAVGVDANPLACLISIAKTTKLTADEIYELEEIRNRALTMGDVLCKSDWKTNKHYTSKASRPDSRSIHFWFNPGVTEELAEIRAWCISLSSDSAKNFALAVFSSIIVAVSKQDSDTRYVRREKNVNAGDVFLRFGRGLHSSLKASIAFGKECGGSTTTRVLNANVLTGPDIGQVDIVITSPPYPNAYSYHLYHMTRMLWLGMDQQKFKVEEIGSHRKYSTNSANGATADTFRAEMRTVFLWLARHLCAEGYVCFVVGDSIIRGKKIDNASLIVDTAADCGYEKVARLQRTIQATKKAFNPSIGKIKEESILILRLKRKAIA